MKYDAKFVRCDPHTEDDAAILGFADDEFDPMDYVLFQRALSPSEQDRALGQDGVHVEINGQEQSGYFYPSGFSCAGGVLKVGFPAAARAELGIDSGIEIRFNPDEVDADRLRRTIRNIFGKEAAGRRPA